jgi:hypothetical protein
MLTNLKAALSVALILAAMTASKHAFRHQTSTTQQRAPVSGIEAQLPKSSLKPISSKSSIRCARRSNTRGDMLLG